MLAERKDLGQLRAGEAGTGFETPHPISVIPERSRKSSPKRCSFSSSSIRSPSSPQNDVPLWITPPAVGRSHHPISFPPIAFVKIFTLMNAPKRTVLFDLHQKLGARMTVFGGFEMPVSYSGIIEEHLAVRASAGIFDLSHMGEFEIRGPHALETLELMFTNLASRLGDGQAQYTIMCAEDGGTIDDLIVYRLDAQRYMPFVDPSNIAARRAWILQAHNRRAGVGDLD